MTIKKLPLASLTLVLVAGLGCATLTPLSSPNSTETAPSGRRPTATPRANSGSISVATSTADSISPVVLRQMEIIEGQVVELRGLEPTAPMERVLLPSAELREVVEQDLLEDYSQEEADDDARLLALFGLLEAEFDLWTFYHDLYAEQIAGFYDDDEGVMYVVRGAGFEGPERLTYAHEFVHALQDQTYDLDEGLGLTNEVCDQDSQRCTALQALVEGDASLVEEQWLRTFATEEDIESILSFYGEFESPVFDSAPPALRESFIFPYQHGLEFVRWLETNGGWSLVDEAYTQPPSSTEFILHPHRYPDDPPLNLESIEIDAVELGAGWRPLDQGSLGEFDFRQILAQELPEEDAIRAADGWGGDTYIAFYNDNRELGAWVVVQEWDTIRDAQDAFFGWRDYGESRFGERTPQGEADVWRADAGYARLERASNQTLWLFGPDEGTALELRELVPMPVSKQ